MRKTFKFGTTMVATVALLAAVGPARAADATLQSLQDQINALQNQLKDLQSKQAAAAATPAPTAAASAPAAATPSRTVYDQLMTDPSRGAFVIPGTNTTLHVGGFIDFQSTYDTGSSVGPAGYAQLAGFNTKNYVLNSGITNGNNGNIALPGTPAAKAIGRFQMDPRFTRLNVETDTPTDYGVIGSVLEFDLDGDGLTASQKVTYSVSPRLRRAFVTYDNWLFGQTQQLTYDAVTSIASIDNNSFMGQFAGNRFPQIQYRWDIDAAKKHQLYVALEAPYSDVTGVAASNFQAGGQMSYQTNAVDHVPDLSVKYVETGTWGRFFTAGTLRNIEVNSDGVKGTSGGVSAGAGTFDPNPIQTSTWSGFIDAGAKVFTTLGDPRNAVFLNANWGPAGGRSVNYAGTNSAIVDAYGKLHMQQTAGASAAYQHYWNNKWVSNADYGIQRQWAQLSMQNTQGLWKMGQQAELNTFYMPTTYLNFGLAWMWINENAYKGQCLGSSASWTLGGDSCSGTVEAGANSLWSGRGAHDNRFEFRARVNY